MLPPRACSLQYLRWPHTSLLCKAGTTTSLLPAAGTGLACGGGGAVTLLMQLSSQVAAHRFGGMSDSLAHAAPPRPFPWCSPIALLPLTVFVPFLWPLDIYVPLWFSSPPGAWGPQSVCHMLCPSPCLRTSGLPVPRPEGSSLFSALAPSTCSRTFGLRSHMSYDQQLVLLHRGQNSRPPSLRTALQPVWRETDRTGLREGRAFTTRDDGGPGFKAPFKESCDSAVAKLWV